MPRKRQTKPPKTGPLPRLPKLPGDVRFRAYGRAVPVEFARGPQHLGLGKAPERRSGPGEPPPEFVQPTRSATEWMVYWALAVIFGDPPDARKPPFNGGRFWTYQKAVLGQFTRQLGSAVIDFLIRTPFSRSIAMRIQTSRFHVNAAARQRAIDAIQAVSVGRRFTVVDIYEQDFIGDKTGQAVIRVVKEALAYGQINPRLNPITSGRAIRVR